jgi:hypothetical protein
LSKQPFPILEYTDGTPVPNAMNKCSACFYDCFITVLCLLGKHDTFLDRARVSMFLMSGGLYVDMTDGGPRFLMINEEIETRMKEHPRSVFLNQMIDAGLWTFGQLLYSDEPKPDCSTIRPACKPYVARWADCNDAPLSMKLDL